MVALRAHRATGSDRHSIDHELVLTAKEGWLIGERPLTEGQPSSGAQEGRRGGTQVLLQLAGRGCSLERLASVAKSRWAIEQFYEDAKGECGLGDFQGGGGKVCTVILGSRC